MIPIWDVGFRDENIEIPTYLHLLGDERKKLIMKFYKGEPLPEGIVAFVFGKGQIKREDVDWTLFEKAISETVVMEKGTVAEVCKDLSWEQRQLLQDAIERLVTGFEVATMKEVKEIAVLRADSDVGILVTLKE